MKAKKKATRKKTTIRVWTKSDISILRARARAKVKTAKIAKELKRTLGAVYQRAAIESISLKGG